MADGSVIIEIEGDAGELEKALNNVSKDAESLADSVDDVSEAFEDATDEAEDMADAIDDVDEGGIDDATDAAKALGSSAGDASDEVDGISNALDDVDGGGLDDASGAAISLGDSAGGAAVEISDVASTLDGVDGSGLDDAANAASDLESSADSAAAVVDDISASLDSVDGSGLDDAASSADDLEAGADGAASAADAVATALGGIDGSTLDSAASSAENLSSSLETVAGNVGKMLGGDVFGGLKGMLSSLPIPAATAGVVALGGAVAVAGGVVASQIGSLAEYGDHIDKTSQKLGISAQAYQEWDAILQHSGTSIDSFGAAFKTLSNAAADGSKSTTAAFEKLGLSIQEVQSMSKEDLFATVISRLQQMEDGTERTAIGADLLGRGIMELGPLLNTSAEDTEAMRQAVHDLGGVMSDDAVKGSAAFQDSLQDLQTAAKGAGRGILLELMPIGTSIMDGLTGALKKAQEILAPVMESVKAAFDSLKETINNTFTPEQQAAISGFLENLAGLLLALPFAVVTTAVTLLVSVFDLLVQAGAAVVEFFQGLPSISEIASSVSSAVSSAFESLKTAISTAVENAKTAVSNAWESVKSATSKTMESVKSTISKAWENVKTTVSSVLDAIKSAVTGAWNAVKSTITSVMDAVKSAVKSAWESVKSTISSVLDSIKSTVSSIWDGIKTTITNAVNNVKSTVSSVFENIKSTISNALNSAKTTVTSIFDSIKTAITDKINAARDTVKNAIEKIKSFFNFSWSLPPLKLPHISVTGGVAPFGIGGKGSLPKFSIAWYAKGGVMKSPTIFGVAGNTLLGGGEAGPEAIAPIKVLQKYIKDAVSGSMSEFVDRMKRAVESETVSISSVLGSRVGEAGGVSNHYGGGTNINVYVYGSADSPQKARDIGREIGAETAREMRRRGLAPA